MRARNVVLNALFLDPGVSGGPETYLRGLAPALREAREEAALTVVTTRRGAAALRDADWPAANIGVCELPCDDGERARRLIAEQLILARVSGRLKTDVLHSLASIAPIRVSGMAHVITLHDVNFIRYATFNAITSWGLQQIIPRAARRADALIADAAASRDDVCELLRLSPERFTVVPLGPGLAQRPDPTPEAEVRARFSLGDGRVLLCVGAKRPHKNQAVLLRALPELPDDLRLVLAGHPEPYEEELRREAAALRIADRVAFPGWVSAEDLEGLWRIASVAALPTLGEGFGLPLLEAMLRGVPTAASDLAVLREVGGDWPVYFDPRSPSKAAEAIRAVLSDPPAPERGIQRAAQFSWDAAAAATWEVYDRAAARKRSGPPKS